jgi:peroxiredoxin
MKSPLILLTGLLTIAACNTSAPSASKNEAHATPTLEKAEKPAMPSAAIGSLAPDFTLSDLDGRPVKLSSFRGKTVVLEWFNPGCPFVRKAHTKGSLKTYASKAMADGVVWLAVNSSAQGKQGNTVEQNKSVATEFGMTHPILRDEDGAIGHAYGATNTPHMFVIDPNGVLVYRGAIDNSPDGEGESPAGGTLVHYVDEALKSLREKAPVKTPETKAYGCGVKYAS